MCTELGQAHCASVVLPEVKRSWWKLQELLKLFAQQKQGIFAFATLEAVREDGSIKLNAMHYTAGISSCGRSNMWQEALRLLEVMPRAKVEPNVFSYSATISACEKAGQWHRAVQLLREMDHKRLQVNVITYSAVIIACDTAAEWQQALQLLSEVSGRSLQVDRIIYNSALLLELQVTHFN